MPSSIQFWEDFFKRYYWEDILDLAKDYPEKRSLLFRFADLERYDMDVASELLEHPDSVLKHANDALMGIDLPADIEFKNTHVRIDVCPDKVRRRNIRREHVDKLISLDGVVQRITDVVPKIFLAAFKCQRCGQYNIIPQTEGKFVEPFVCESDDCGRRGPFKLVNEGSEFIDSQKIRLQEQTEDLKSGEKSQTIDLDIDDDLVGIVLPGNRVTVTGIVRAYQRVKAQGKSTYFDLVMDVIHIKIIEGQETIVLTPETKRRMNEIAQAHPDNIVDVLVGGFAPTVHGMEIMKEGLLCCAVSNGFKLRQDGTPQREFSHILICSDPGMAKSNLKHALKKIMPRLILSSGTGSTTAGLTAATLKDDFADGSWSVEAGVLALADGGGAALDEFDKFDKKDIKKLNDALSNCQFEVDRAGFHLKLWARCFVAAFQNPKSGRFDPYEPLPEQVDIPPDTLSRFDLIYTLSDDVNETNDLLVGTKIADAWMGAPEVNGDDVPIEIEVMQKYIAYAQTIHPEFKQEVVDAIIKQYIWARRRSVDGRVAVTPRYQESLFRLSKAEAQLHLSGTVEISHLNRAIKLLETSILQVGTDDQGRLDADILATGQSKSQRDRVKILTSLIIEVQKDHNGIAPLGEIILIAQDRGFVAEDIPIMLKKMKTNGDIIELNEGKFKVV